MLAQLVEGKVDWADFLFALATVLALVVVIVPAVRKSEYAFSLLALAVAAGFGGLFVL